MSYRFVDCGWNIQRAYLVGYYKPQWIMALVNLLLILLLKVYNTLNENLFHYLIDTIHLLDGIKRQYWKHYYYRRKTVYSTYLIS